MQQLLPVLSTLNHVSGLMFSSCIDKRFAVILRLYNNSYSYSYSSGLTNKIIKTVFASDRMSQQFCSVIAFFGWFCNKDKITNI